MTRANQVKGLDLAIIGYPQAGKTTLAVGLYATSTENFTVIGEGEDTESYLCSRKAMLETGHWLDATQERDRPELCLKIMRRGRTPAWIRFKEYMGELAYNSETYKRDVIGKPRGALILLNPKMDILSDAIRRIEMLAQMREIVSYLAADEVGCEYVAVVTTASDLLEGCDSEFRENFNDYKAEVVNAIKTSKFGEQGTWKEFAVTVSGKLEDVTRPRIARGADNTSRLPFVWIIDELEKKAQAQIASRRMRRALMAASLAVGGLAAAFVGWFFGLDRMAERELARQTEEPVRLLKAAVEGRKTGDKFADISRNCELVEKAIAQAGSSPVFFSANSNRLVAAQHDLCNRIDEGRMIAFPLRFGQMRKEAERQAAEETVKAWRGEFEDWKPVSEEAARQRQKLLDDFDAEVAEWRKAYEGRVYREDNEKLRAKLRNLKVEDDGAGNELHGLLSECRRVEKNAAGEEAFPLVAYSVRTSAWAAVRKVRDQTLEKLVRARLSDLRADSPSCPKLDDERWDFFENTVAGRDVMSQADKAAFLDRIEKEVKSRQDAWTERENAKCREVISRFAQKEDAYQAVMEFRDFYQYHPYAPELNSVVSALHERIGSDVRRLVGELKTGGCSDYKKNFSDMRMLCNALLRVKCPAMKNSCWYTFAERCRNEGKIDDGFSKAFMQTCMVSRVRAHLTTREFAQGGSGDGRPSWFSFGLNGYFPQQGIDEEACLEGRKWWRDNLVRGESDLDFADHQKPFNAWNSQDFRIVMKMDWSDRSRDWIKRVWNISEKRPGDFENAWTCQRPKLATDIDVSVRFHMDIKGKAIWEYLPENTELELK